MLKWRWPVALPVVLALVAACTPGSEPEERIPVAIVILELPAEAAMPSWTVGSAEVRAAVFDGGGSVAAVWREMSEGRVEVENRGVHRVPVPMTAVANEGQVCDEHAWRALADRSLRDAEVDPGPTIVGYLLDGNPRCAWAGPSSETYSWEAWLTAEPRPLGQQALALLGLAAGFPRPFTGVCASRGGMTRETCAPLSDDPLSALSGNAERYPSSTLVRRGWLPPERQQRIIEPKQYELSVSGATVGPVALTIPLGGGAALDIEYSRHQDEEAVELRVVGLAPLSTCLIAAGDRPESYDALRLGKGETFTDNFTGVKLTVNDVDRYRAKVEVTQLPTATSSVPETGVGACMG